MAVKKLILTVILAICFLPGYSQGLDSIEKYPLSDSIEFLIPTFRGNVERNFYGYGRVDRLDVIWKFYLGEGITVISRKLGERKWKGAGWTGQPLIVKEGVDTFLIQGSFDHHLYKINSRSGTEIWKYKFDDVVKGTGTLWANNNTANKEQSVIILQGSRLGTQHFLDTDYVPSYRAISYFTGKEIWRMNSKLTHSYSRDVDASSLIYRDTAYLGLENGILTVFSPNPELADSLDGMFQPARYENHLLYEMEDMNLHGGNLVTESSPAMLGDRIYLASGSGHVYGYNLKTRKIDWDFFIGSDMDGSVVVTSDSCLLVSVEKQYIDGKGGVLKLNPSKVPEESVVWYLPVEDTVYASWEGGVIGTAGINDYYINDNGDKLAAISALDGYTYIVRHTKIADDTLVFGPSNHKKYNIPELICKLPTGPGISSPILTSDRLIVCGYNGIFLYSYEEGNFNLLDHLAVGVEATPIIYGDRLYIASRDGFLYCLGEKE